MVLIAVGLMAAGSVAAAERVALRAESFTVPPSAHPLVFVAIKNETDVLYQGAIAMKVPEGWRLVPPQREVSLAPGEIKRLPFTVERGVSVESNLYPVEVSAVGAGTTVVRKQNVACASAPYFKATIDGKPDEWKDAIPIAFITGGKKTVISTYWNRRQFALLVAVEESKLIGYREDDVFDALQVAIPPQGAA